MNRRALLTYTGVALVSGLAGCSDRRSDVDTISVTEATVRQGETARLSIAAPTLSGLHIAEFPEAFRPGGPLELGEATFRPSPDAVWQAHPPYWDFPGKDTTGEVPIRTAPDAPLGTYQFGFDFELDGEEDPRHEETTVTVERDSE
ncbi:MAG: hypothetical protein ACI8U4_001448 [Natronomonas sp.]|jgi:hypothetical protein